MASPTGVWLAYYPDKSELFIHSSELVALRYATEHGMKVAAWPYGKSLSEVLPR